MQDVFLAAPVRTAIGDFGGIFKDIPGNELAMVPIKECIKRSGIDPAELDDVIFGNCFMRTDEPNVARVAALKAGIPFHVPGMTIQRQCSSSMQAAVFAMQRIQCGDADMILVGGMESMSQAPYVLKDARWGKRLMHGQLTDTVWEGLTCPNTGLIMGITAENLAEKYSITREEQDVVALRSHMNASDAAKSGRFADEIVPVEITGRKGDKTLLATDEHIRHDLTIEALAKLKPTFKKDGTVTPGNSSGLNDGASAALVVSESKAKALGLKPIARFVSHAVAGVEPELMGYGPVPATRKALTRAGMSLSQIGLVEVNEAFAAQYLACEKLLELDRSITNVNGSGIGLGHPVGATGLRLLITLSHEMRRRSVKYGLATLCVGGGMGKAVILENVA
ncbi:MAG: acetyl-CoA C-acetyltransferase [Deltaproteobacteria bacterium]|nr:acetyl-CoA C-acetyltransferase [Deltaproteobacteria bacterium]